MLETKHVKKKIETNYLVKFNFLSKISKFDQNIMKKLTLNSKLFDDVATIIHHNVDPNKLITEFYSFFEKENLEFEEDQIKEFALSLHKHKTRGTTAYSFKALQELLQYMKEGKSESDAKEILGIKKLEDYSKFPKGIKYLKPINKDGILQYEIDENTISNHVIKSLISWANRVIIDLHAQYGSFDIIKLESTKELSQPDDVKQNIKKAQNDNQNKWEDLKKRYRNHFETVGLNIENNKQYLLKIKLWEQQGKIGIYSGKPLGIADILSNKTEIEHIVPRE